MTDDLGLNTRVSVQSQNEDDSQLGTLGVLGVPIGQGPPTRDELRVHYPPQFTWTQLKTFINSGDLGLLQRDRSLHKRYEAWTVGVKEKYGSMSNYLLKYRIQWGQPDTISALRRFDHDSSGQSQSQAGAFDSEHGPRELGTLPPLPPDAPGCVSSDTPPEYVSVIYNDWPGPIPSDVDHYIVWTRIPLCDPELVHQSIRSRVENDGLWGFTGNRSPPPSPSCLPACLPALADWGITLENMRKQTRGTEEEEAIIRKLVENINDFVKSRWPVNEYETAWFLNPSRLQSVPNLYHIHLYARHHDVEG